MSVLELLYPEFINWHAPAHFPLCGFDLLTASVVIRTLNERAAVVRLPFCSCKHSTNQLSPYPAHMQALLRPS